MDLEVYRGEGLNLTVQIDRDVVRERELVGRDIIRATIHSTSVLDIAIKDYINHDGMKFYVNTTPAVRKVSHREYIYTVIFENEYYDLIKAQYLFAEANEFNLVGDVEDFIDLIVTNMNRVFSGWTKGTCDQSNSDYKNLHFKADSCFTVLNKLCEEFEGEFYITDGDIINFTDKVGSDTGLTFKYKEGLRSITRNAKDSEYIVTRVYGHGSEKNIGEDYRVVDGIPARRLMFDDNGNHYLENNVGTYGTIEFTKYFDDIYPHRDGTISWVDGGNELIFRDSGMDFDLNSYLLEGIPAELNFKSGDLCGYTFKIESYGDGDKEFKLIPDLDEHGFEMPNDTLKPAIGDKYVVLGIKLPSSYITTAETALKNATQAFIDINSIPVVTYTVDQDPKYFRRKGISVGIGDTVTLVDTALGIDSLLRIVRLSYPLLDTYDYTFELSNDLELNASQRLYMAQKIQGRTLHIDGIQLVKNKIELTHTVTDSQGNATSILQNASNILLRVAKDDVINQINISTEGILIQADNIQISGVITIESWRKSGDLTKIDGGKVAVSSKVVVGTGTDVSVLDGAHASYRLYIGHSTPTSAPFRITKGGDLWASSASITGAINTTEGWITGTLSVENVITLGKTGTQGLIKSYGKSAYGSGQGLWLEYTAGNVPRLDLYKDANNYFQYDGNKILIKAANFELDGSGNITATNVTLTGVITANTGYIGGASGWTISEKTITGAADSIIAGGTIKTSASGSRVEIGGSGIESYLKFLDHENRITGHWKHEININQYVRTVLEVWQIDWTTGALEFKTVISSKGLAFYNYGTGGAYIQTDADGRLEHAVTPAAGKHIFNVAGTTRWKVGDTELYANADISLYSGKKIILDGEGGNDYMVYQNSRIEFFVNGVLEGYIDANGFVST